MTSDILIFSNCKNCKNRNLLNRKIFGISLSGINNRLMFCFCATCYSVSRSGPHKFFTNRAENLEPKRNNMKKMPNLAFFYFLTLIRYNFVLLVSKYKIWRGTRISSKAYLLFSKLWSVYTRTDLEGPTD